MKRLKRILPPLCLVAFAVDLGLILLILTPVIRVAASIIGFALERVWTFVAITSFVLAMLILSFVLGNAGG